MPSPSHIVFSDLDGTLLDHDTYSYAPALPALEGLKARGIPVVLASSKTAAEIAPLRGALGLAHCPAIVENGAGVLAAHADADAGAAEYARLRACLDDLPAALRAQYRGFGDWSDQQVSDKTGLPLAQARLARVRAFSEPGLWSGDAAGRAAFLAALSAMGVHAKQGGRYLTLSFGGTKADRMGEVVALFAVAVGDAPTVIALGDAPNDIEMLQAADIGVVIANAHAAPLPSLAGEGQGAILRSTKFGPDGWNEMIQRVVLHKEEQ